MVKKDLAWVLREQGFYKEKQLATYQKAAEEKGLPLYEYLVKEAKLDTEKLAQAYSKISNTPLVSSLNEDEINTELLGRVPIKFLRDNMLFPLVKDRQIVVLTADPFAFQPLDDLRLAINASKSAVATPQFIIDSLNRYYPIEGTKKVMEELEAEGDTTGSVIDFNTISEEDILGLAQDAPIVKLVNNILWQAVKRGASDIHIEPFEKELRIRYRIDGNLYAVMNPPKRVQSALSSRLKILAQLNIAEKRQPQDGRIQIKFPGKPIDIRVSILPVVYGERIVMRLLDKSKSFVPIEDLGMSDRDLQIVKDSISQPNGIVLVTGPTGSGKTSTLYSILFRLNTPEVCIITVEDPVEYQMAGIGQVGVKEKIGLTFAAALRSILRQDPDVVMIGETRDQETAQIAIQAALTGHIVLTTLHTNSAAASITRLIDMGIEPFLIASSLTMVIAQRLVRRLCENCKEAYKPTAEELRRLPGGGTALQGSTIFKAKGCSICMGSGYKGRLPIFEVMKMSSAVSKLTLEHADAATIEEAARKDGMTLLVDHGLEKVKEGATTIEEVLSVAMSYDEGVDDAIIEKDKELIKKKESEEK